MVDNLIHYCKQDQSACNELDYVFVFSVSDWHSEVFN